MKQKGFTLIEALIMIAIGGIVVAVAAMYLSGNSGNRISFGMNGLTELRCIDGYRFVVGENGQARQVMDEFGKGVKCENPNAGKPGAFGRW